MTNCHRNGDTRICGATTIVTGQNFVFVDGQLWAVNGDPESHGEGNLIASCNYIYISNKPIIQVGDSASPDGLCQTEGPPHCEPSAVGFDNLIMIN